MVSYKQDQIAAVSACLAGIATDEQRAIVEEWKNSSEKNMKLWERLNNKRALREKMANIDLTDIEKGWRKLELRINRRRMWRRRLSIAAAGAAAAVALLLVIQPKDTEESSLLASQDETEANSRAQLILADGSVVRIDELESMEIREGDGATIYKESDHIDYSRATAQAQTELIYNELRVQHGMPYSMTLSDGTKVFMNSESRLRFPVQFLGDERMVEFEGEAYFSVAKDADKSFIIKTGDLEVVVLGTEFNLKGYNDDKEIVTTLVSGKVQVRDDSNAWNIKPGEQAVYKTGTGEFSTRKVDVDFYTAWRRNEILFKDTRLDEVMKDLSRWYEIEYEFMDDQVAALKLGGSFKRTVSIEPILDMIAEIGLVKVTRSGSKIYFSSENL